MAGNKQYNPRHLQIIRLHLMGFSNDATAQMVGYTTQQVSNVINGPDGQDIIAQVQAAQIETFSQVQAMAQLVVPEVLNEKIRLALSSADERVRTINCQQILEMTGNAGTKKLQVEINEGPKNYETTTEEDLKNEILKAVGIEPPTKDPTLH